MNEALGLVHNGRRLRRVPSAGKVVVHAIVDVHNLPTGHGDATGVRTRV